MSVLCQQTLNTSDPHTSHVTCSPRYQYQLCATAHQQHDFAALPSQQALYLFLLLLSCIPSAMPLTATSMYTPSSAKSQTRETCLAQDCARALQAQPSTRARDLHMQPAAHQTMPGLSTRGRQCSQHVPQQLLSSCSISMRAALGGRRRVRPPPRAALPGPPNKDLGVPGPSLVEQGAARAYGLGVGLRVPESSLVEEVAARGAPGALDDAHAPAVQVVLGRHHLHLAHRALLQAIAQACRARRALSGLIRVGTGAI
jgi:hypothetical protein